MREDWCDWMASGPTTSFLPATLAIFADQDGMPAATATESVMKKGGSRGLAGVSHSWPQSCFLNVSSQAFKGLRERRAQESKQALRLRCSKLAQDGDERKQKAGAGAGVGG